MPGKGVSKTSMSELGRLTPVASDPKRSIEKHGNLRLKYSSSR
jgi:hypothetical protein